MTGNGTIELNGTIEHVFKKLLDPEVLTECIMGCKSMELIEEGKYRADLSVGIAAIKGKYDAYITVEEVQAPHHFKLVVHGEGGPGFVDAEGIIDLTSLGDSNTTLSYTYNAEVGGKVAAIGQRMLGGVAKMLIGDFFKRIKKNLEHDQKSA